MIDGAEKFDEQDDKIYNQIKQYNPLVVLNKQDISIEQDLPFEVLSISAKNNQGIEQLKEQIHKRTIKEKIDTSAMVLTNQRHVLALQNAKQLTQQAIQSLPFVSMDIANFEIRKIWLELGKITGVSENEKIIDEIFARFCLGK